MQLSQWSNRVVLLCISLCSGQIIYPPNTGLNSTSSPYTDAQNATVFALTYGAPLPVYAGFIDPTLSSKGANALDSENATANANSAAVIRPNVDTLYTRMGIDLSSSNVAITIPEINDGRFYIYPFYDIYGDNFANLGSLTNSTAGTYLLQRASDAQVNPGVDLSDPPSGYQGVINFPTTYGFLLGRILLRNNGTDLDVVHGYQAGTQVSLVNRSNSVGPAPPPLTVDLLNDSFTGSAPEQLLQLTARLSQYDPPEVLDEIANVTAILALAGINNGTYTQPPAVNLTAAVEGVELGIYQDLTNPAHVQGFGNGWEQFISELSGNFNSDFAARTYIAETGYAQLVSTVTLYPAYVGEDSSASLFVGPCAATLFTFSAKPKVKGFWSLTAYGENQYLIPNGLEVYALGDRSNLTYPDGALLYGDSDHADDEFQILIQPADVTPPSNWTSNWLPAPSGGGQFSVNLRFYGPTEELTNGSYVYPLVTNHKIFTANGSSCSSSNGSASTNVTVPYTGEATTSPRIRRQTLVTAACISLLVALSRAF